MATLEELLSQALGAGQQQVIQDDPYAPLAGTANQIGNIFTQSAAVPQLMEGNGTRDAILGAAISGLFGGAMTGLSSDYKTDRTAKYNDLLLGAMGGQDVRGNPDVTSALARTAQTQAEQMQALQGFRAADDTRLVRNQIGANAANQLAANPNTARKLVKELLGVEVGEPTPIAVPAGVELGQDASMVDKYTSLYNTLIEGGNTPSQASMTARSIINDEMTKKQNEQKELLKEQTESYKRIDEAARGGEALGRMVDQLEYYVENAGYTGVGGGVSQQLARAMGNLNPDMASKAAAGESLESLGADIVRNARQIGSGPMSDRDVALYMSSGPRLTNTADANKEIIDRMRYASKLQQGYADFMLQQRDRGVPLIKAEQEWRNIVKENPYLVKDEETGRMAPNRSWLEGLSSVTSKPSAAAPTIEATAPMAGNLTIADVDAMTPEQAAALLKQLGQ